MHIPLFSCVFAGFSVAKCRFERRFFRVFVRLNVRLTYLFRFDNSKIPVRLNVRFSGRLNLGS
nr:MAG TPA: hypothetical protein [Caudoviricetes sp.]